MTPADLSQPHQVQRRGIEVFVVGRWHADELALVRSSALAAPR